MEIPVRRVISRAGMKMERTILEPMKTSDAPNAESDFTVAGSGAG